MTVLWAVLLSLAFINEMADKMNGPLKLFTLKILLCDESRLFNAFRTFSICDIIFEISQRMSFYDSCNDIKISIRDN